MDKALMRISPAAAGGADRVELYTEAYARGYAADPARAIAPYAAAAEEVRWLVRRRASPP